MNFPKVWLSGFMILGLCDCIHGPKTEKKSPLNYLNGDHYQEEGRIFSVPVLERKTVLTKIRGQVMFDLKPVGEPLRFQKIGLYLGENKIFETTSDQYGRFEFRESIANGSYRLILMSEKYQGSTPLEVTKYEIGGIELIVTRK